MIPELASGAGLLSMECTELALLNLALFPSSVFFDFVQYS